MLKKKGNLGKEAQSRAIFFSRLHTIFKKKWLLALKFLVSNYYHAYWETSSEDILS